MPQPPRAPVYDGHPAFVQLESSAASMQMPPSACLAAFVPHAHPGFAPRAPFVVMLGPSADIAFGYEPTFRFSVPDKLSRALVSLCSEPSAPVSPDNVTTPLALSSLADAHARSRSRATAAAAAPRSVATPPAVATAVLAGTDMSADRRSRANTPAASRPPANPQSASADSTAPLASLDASRSRAAPQSASADSTAPVALLDASRSRAASRRRAGRRAAPLASLTASRQLPSRDFDVVVSSGAHCKNEAHRTRRLRSGSGL